ncbi:MAG: aldo/keto reductase [Xanthomonadales bacterium]|nr:aldo/keto reductase [Xanthomonadales bacterium]
MLNRRSFIQWAGAAAAAAVTPAGLAETREMLPARAIPSSGELLPVIGMGNSNAFRAGDMALSRQVIERFQSYGSRYIDCIGPSRFVVAEVARDLELGDRAFLGTYFDLSDEATARDDADRILGLAGKSSLDLVNGFTEQAIPQWDAFRRWKAEGRTRHIGVARHNQRYYESTMKLMKTGSVDVIQINYSLLEPEADQRILPMAADLGVAVTINRPFINGRYFQVVKGKTLPDWASEFDCASWAQFSLKFILSHPAVTCVLTETANPKHAVDNLGAGYGRLPDAATRNKMLELVRSWA